MRATISTKNYKCFRCGKKQRVETNHFGEIYSNCVSCKCSPLQCIEPEAVEAREVRPTLKTVAHYYYFNIDLNAEDAEEYQKLKKTMKKAGRKCRRFGSVSPYNDLEGHSQYNGKEIELYIDWLGSEQWSSPNGLRWHEWVEYIVPNENIKVGSYLEITEEMTELLTTTLKCGYCGHEHTNEKTLKFCNKCMDSEYLSKSDLPLLRLMPANFNGSRGELSEAELFELMPVYLKAQTVATGSRNKAKLEAKRKELKEDYDKTTSIAKTEYEGFIWLMDNGVNIDNCIFYNHSNIFSFGWRNKVSDEVKSELLDILCEFQFPYEIDAENGKISTVA